MEYEQTKGRKYNKINIQYKGVKVNIKTTDKHSKAIKGHIEGIKANRAKIKQLKKDNRVARLLIKQVKTTKKLEQLQKKGK